MRTKPAALAAALVLLTGYAAPQVAAHHEGEVASAGGLKVSHAWTYENAAMAHGMEVYLTVSNTGESPDRLVGAAVDFAERVQIQAQVLGRVGVLQTRPIDAVEIAPGPTLSFQPGGARLILMSVQRQFDHGQHFDLQLNFANAGPVEVEVEVEDVEEAVGKQPGS